MFVVSDGEEKVSSCCSVLDIGFVSNIISTSESVFVLGIVVGSSWVLVCFVRFFHQWFLVVLVVLFDFVWLVFEFLDSFCRCFQVVDFPLCILSCCCFVFFFCGLCYCLSYNFCSMWCLPSFSVVCFFPSFVVFVIRVRIGQVRDVGVMVTFVFSEFFSLSFGSFRLFLWLLIIYTTDSPTEHIF